MKRLIFITLLAVSFFVAPLIAAQDGSDMPSLAELDEGWNTLMPGGDTACSLGTPYNFHVRPADSDKLLLFFNGGGACWFGQQCDPELEPNTHTPVAEVANNPTDNGGTGIFDLTNEENPFADYNMVFLPYCTGDVFVGAGPQVYTYEADGESREITIFHNGYINTMAVLDWVYANFESPGTVVVAGSSAGSLGASFYTGFVAEHYPEASIIHIGDGAGGYRNTAAPVAAWHTMEILPEWETVADISPETLDFTDFYIAAEKTFPNVVIAQYNAAEDEVQYGFNQLLGNQEFTLPEYLFLNHNEIRENVGADNYFTYTAGGPVHTILRLPQFYTYEEEGVRVVDWVSALINGEPVDNISCDYFAGDCLTPPDAR